MRVEEFAAQFERFQHSAFRVEARDHYDVDAEREAFAAFRQGRELPHRNAQNDPWLACVAANAAAGRVIERVRVVSEPLTDYTRFEFAAYRDNIVAGEKIRVLPRRLLTDRDQLWAGDDFWIFDEAVIVLMSYDDQGRFRDAQQSEDGEQYLKAKQRALRIAIEFDDFVAQFRWPAAAPS